MSDDGETPRRFASKPKPELQKTDIFWQAFIAALMAQAVVEVVKRLGLWA